MELLEVLLLLLQLIVRQRLAGQRRRRCIQQSDTRLVVAHTHLQHFSKQKRAFLVQLAEVVLRERPPPVGIHLLRKHLEHDVLAVLA